CRTQRMKLFEARQEISNGSADAAERALGFAPASCVVAAHDELRARLRQLRAQLVSGPRRSFIPVGASEAAKLYAQAQEAFAQKNVTGYQQAKALLQGCIRAEPSNAACHLMLGASLGQLAEGE